MGRRGDEVRARYDAELALAGLEDELADAKAAGEPTRDLKLRLREARQAFREARSGDVAVNPQAIQVNVTVPTLEA